MTSAPARRPGRIGPFRETLETPLSDDARLDAACRLDGLGVRALNAAAARGLPPDLPVHLRLWARRAADPAPREIRYGSLREIRDQLDAGDAPVVLSYIEAEILIPGDAE